MQNLKEKVMNASFKTRLFVTGAVASVSTLGPAAFADESVSSGARAVRSASTDAVTTTLNEIKLVLLRLFLVVYQFFYLSAG